ncbi:hypothetical protein M4J06_001392 [Streptomyces coelicoflavus]|uniref:hypothetical protein n=1 Tax=Streptomyces coelicoflavus TaxID=285562 RepID=UPI0021089BB5|nr:hypothetical protein [Streptomyces coelicoflavus]MCQ4199523.1 hypothetical protein [Streptomyces coelicoflavus]
MYAPDWESAIMASGVHGYYRHNSEAEREEIRRLGLDASHSVHILPAKCRPGIYGIAWGRRGPGPAPAVPLVALARDDAGHERWSLTPAGGRLLGALLPGPERPTRSWTA